MKVAIIGAGFTGLAAAYYISLKGHRVEVFESSKKPGGLAAGFKKRNWSWSVENHYHHIFTSDWEIQNLAQSINHKIIFKQPKTSFYINGNNYQLDSIISLLTFPFLSPLNRIRTGFVIAFLKIYPFWKHLEKITAKKFLKTAIGTKSWHILWQPLFKTKFGNYENIIPASWFWARIKKRSASLGYPHGGFDSLAQSISRKIIHNGGKFYFNQKVDLIQNKGNKIMIQSGSKKGYFDKLVFTLPTSKFLEITSGLPSSYIKKLSKLKSLGAITLVLILKKKFLKDNTYWLNIGSKGFPFLGIVEHTNFISSHKYNNEKVVYISNYLESSHPYFSTEAQGVLKEYYTYIKKINPNFDKKWIKQIYAFKAHFAQPIFTNNYSKAVPPLTTPIKNVYLANMQQIYPWDRGTNYAVKLGKKVAELI